MVGPAERSEMGMVAGRGVLPAWLGGVASRSRIAASQRGSQPSRSFTRVTMVIMGHLPARGTCKFNARERERGSPPLAVDELLERLAPAGGGPPARGRPGVDAAQTQLTGCRDAPRH